jgi:hypothetical protein
MTDSEPRSNPRFASNGEGPTEAARVPPSAVWLGALGALPFVALSGSLPWLNEPLQSLATQALLGYGAVILSFLGGIHWGLAIATPIPADVLSLRARLILSVLPSLIAWPALLLGKVAGLWLLAVGIAAMLGVDLEMTRRGFAPAWYPRLRLPLSGVVCACLVSAALLVRA